MLRDHALAKLPLTVEQLLRTLADIPIVERVLLFGSRAHGDAGARSDIDLAIEAPDATRRQWIEIALLVEDADMLLPIDLVRLEEAAPALRKRILTEGIILYDEALALRIYQNIRRNFPEMERVYQLLRNRYAPLEGRDAAKPFRH
jgi:predicted nucleotidyltransferase